MASSLAQKLESWTHKVVAANVVGARFLEVGAGTLNQITYFQIKKIEYYDVVEPPVFLYQNSPLKAHIRHFFSDIEECNHVYDTIFSIAALEHVVNLPHTLAKMGTLLRENGSCINAIPSDGFLWGLGWRASTGLAYKLRTGFSYKALMRHEHVNNHDEIITLHRYFFDQVKLAYFPIHSKIGRVHV